MPRPLALRLLILGFTVGALSAPVRAGEYYFKTPSGNIYCGYFDYDNNAQVRCDIKSFTPSVTERPSDCELDWGDAFAVGAADSQGSIVCHGDTVISPDAETLAYGETWESQGISCTSSAKGLTCKNSAGHGFILSKAKQNIF